MNVEAHPDRDLDRARYHSNQLIERYGYGIEASKVDRIIAQRMAENGVAEEQIARILRELSLNTRIDPAEKGAYCAQIAAQATKRA